MYCVNGAATGWPRKGGRLGSLLVPAKRQWGRDRMAAEGADPHFPGSNRCWRQWGRDRMAAEGCMAPNVHVTYMGVNGAATGWPRKVGGHVRAHVRPNVASMGPRPDGRGRRDVPRQNDGAASASMGPRPDGRGRVLAGQGTFDAPSVNGAATGWPRKGSVPADFVFLDERQWGRDRMAAEGCTGGRSPSATPRVNGAATGWPRKEVHVAAGRVIQLLASMGPRPDGRGRTVRADWRQRLDRRQWGRDRMAAEGLDV